jgi:hypothetical protein
MIRSAAERPYIPLDSHAHPGTYLKTDEEPDPAVLMGLIPSETLCDFDENKVLSSRLECLDGSLTPEDAVRLVSLLCVPYLRIPGLLSLFSQERSIGPMLYPRLQATLIAALFEPLCFRSSHQEGKEPWSVPLSSMDRREKLATSHGLLLNELWTDPAAVIRPLVALADIVLPIAEADRKDKFVKLLLVIARIVTRLHGFVLFARANPALGHASPECLRSLATCDDDLRNVALRTLPVLRFLATSADERDDLAESVVLRCHVVLLLHCATDEWLLEELSLGLASATFVMSWYTPASGSGCLDSQEVQVLCLA